MKRFSIVAMVAAVAMLFGSLSASAQFHLGLKAGINTSELHFNEKTFDGSNRTGYNIGAMLEFSVPLTGLGVDASLMYVRRNAEFMSSTGSALKNNRDYIDIPINLKWKLGLPVIGRVVTPYLATGPSFAFLTSRRAFEDAYQNKKFDTSWNFGFGVELCHKVQVGASYGLGLTKALKSVGATGTSNIEGKNRYWTITATYFLF